MLKFKRYKHKKINMLFLKGAEVLNETLLRYRLEMRPIMHQIREAYRGFTMDERMKAAEIKGLSAQIQKIDEFIVDVAHKLAPYQTPKLETIEVKNKIEHKFVLRAPQQIKNVNEWMQKTGAEVLKATDVKKAAELAPIEPSLNDFDNEEDEINTSRLVN